MKSNFTIETLGLTATRILPGFLRLGSGLSLLMSAFSLLIFPPFFSKKLLQLTERSATPLVNKRVVTASVNVLSPFTFSAPNY